MVRGWRGAVRRPSVKIARAHVMWDMQHAHVNMHMHMHMHMHMCMHIQHAHAQ